MNVVTACRACNHRKSNRTPEQARMPLLYAPYVPSLWEDFILRNRRILADQMEFLMAHLPKSRSRLAPASVGQFQHVVTMASRLPARRRPTTRSPLNSATNGARRDGRLDLRGRHAGARHRARRR